MNEQLKLFESDDQPAQTREKKDFTFLLRYLGVGEDQAISMTFLARVLNVDKRTVRSFVHNARLNGYVIVGNDSGYFVPRTEAEVTAWLNRQECALRSKAKALRSAREALKDEVYERSDCTSEV